MKKISKFLSYLLTICMIFSLFSVCATSVTVSATTVIEISSEAELRKIGRDSAYPLSGSYVLTADIDLLEEWVPIGLDSLTDTSDSYFTGSFDGQGHIISNMWTENREGEEATLRTLGVATWGMFSKIKDSAYIGNLAFENIQFNVGRTGSNLTTVGAVVGRIEGPVTIENIAVLSGNITVTSNHYVEAGGIAGSFAGDSCGYKISNCYNAATVSSAFGSRVSKYSSYVVAAGILADTEQTTNSYKNVIENCFNVGEIIVSGGTGQTFKNLGGNIVTYVGKSATATITTTLRNNMEAGTLTLTNASQLSADALSTEKVRFVNQGVPSAYSALTSVKDAEGNAIWSAKSGYYPMLSMFADYAKPAPEVEYIYIENAEQLLKIGVDAEYPLDGNYMLTSDIDVSDTVWTAIGNDGTAVAPFTGLLDGDGHTITGMNTGKDSAALLTTGNWGMFATLEGVVRNLQLKDVYFNTYITDGTGNVGAVAGAINGGEVENVSVSGTIIDNGSKYVRAGGIAGTTAAAKYKISNCFIDVDITAGYPTTSTSYGVGAAGVLGNAYYEGSVSDCLYIGELTSTYLANYPTNNLGAIVSDANGLYPKANVENCYSTGEINYGKAYGSFEEDYTSVTKYELLNCALSGKLPAAYWETGIMDLTPYLNAFPAPEKSSQSLGDASVAITNMLEGTLITNYTDSEEITALAQKCLQLGSTVFEISSFTLTKATTSANGTLEISYSLKGEGETSAENHSVSLDISKLPVLSYEYATEKAGNAQGVITITDADYSGKDYSLYWGNENGILEGFAALSDMSDIILKDETAGVLTYNAVNYTLIPETATALYLCLDNKEICAVEIPEARRLSAATPNYTYGVVSDTHFSKMDRSQDAFISAMSVLRDKGSAFMSIAGDVTDNGKAEQYAKFTEIYKGDIAEIPVWATVGNHDTLYGTVTPAVGLANIMAAFPNYANPDHTCGEDFVVTAPDKELKYDYTVEYGGDLYVYLGVGEDIANVSDFDGNYRRLTDSQINWLDEVMNNYYNVEKKEGEAFVIFHFFPLEFGQYSSAYDLDEVSSEKFHLVMNRYPGAVTFNGHNHFRFSSDMNVYSKGTYMSVHVPVLYGYYEGYIVERYDGYTLAKGYNFRTDEYIPCAMIYIDHDEFVPTAFGETTIEGDTTTIKDFTVETLGNTLSYSTSSDISDLSTLDMITETDPATYYTSSYNDNLKMMTLREATAFKETFNTQIGVSEFKVGKTVPAGEAHTYTLTFRLGAFKNTQYVKSGNGFYAELYHSGDKTLSDGAVILNTAANGTASVLADGYTSVGRLYRAGSEATNKFPNEDYFTVTITFDNREGEEEQTVYHNFGFMAGIRYSKSYYHTLNATVTLCGVNATALEEAPTTVNDLSLDLTGTNLYYNSESSSGTVTTDKMSAETDPATYYSTSYNGSAKSITLAEVASNKNFRIGLSEFKVGKKVDAGTLEAYYITFDVSVGKTASASSESGYFAELYKSGNNLVADNSLTINTNTSAKSTLASGFESLGRMYQYNNKSHKSTYKALVVFDNRKGETAETIYQNFGLIAGARAANTYEHLVTAGVKLSSIEEAPVEDIPVTLGDFTMEHIKTLGNSATWASSFGSSSMTTAKGDSYFVSGIDSENDLKFNIEEKAQNTNFRTSLSELRIGTKVAAGEIETYTFTFTSQMKKNLYVTGTTDVSNYNSYTGIFAELYYADTLSLGTDYTLGRVENLADSSAKGTTFTSDTCTSLGRQYVSSTANNKTVSANWTVTVTFDNRLGDSEATIYQYFGYIAGAQHINTGHGYNRIFDADLELTSIEEIETPTIEGDVTGDDKADLKDIIRMKKYIAGYDVALIGKGDLNEDGSIDALDITSLRHILVGITK